MSRHIMHRVDLKKVSVGVWEVADLGRWPFGSEVSGIITYIFNLRHLIYKTKMTIPYKFTTLFINN